VKLSDEFDAGSDNVEFTIMSKHAVDSNSFVWNKNGAIHVINSDPNVSKHSVLFCLSNWNSSGISAAICSSEKIPTRKVDGYQRKCCLCPLFNFDYFIVLLFLTEFCPGAV
jgi:hypothetical protein